MAASLFALDEIAETPRLLAPRPFIEPGIPLQRMDSAEESLPYLPAWPELASIYHAPTLTIPQALSGGMNLIIIGQPGDSACGIVRVGAWYMLASSGQAGR